MTVSALMLILLVGAVSTLGPGPASLAVIGTSTERGRRTGLAFAMGVVTGALAWSVAAAFGLFTVMAANAWLLEGLRIAGALYLLWMAWRSAHSALRADAAHRGPPDPHDPGAMSLRSAWLRGLVLHLTNPKPVFFFGSLYAVGIPPGTDPAWLAVVVVAMGVQSTLIYVGFAVLFSTRRVANSYARLCRPLDALFAILFGAAGLRLLAARTP